MGVKYVVVRNDLIRSGPDRRLAGPGQPRAGQFAGDDRRWPQFGPLVGTAAPDDAVTNFDPPYPAVEIYQVAAARRRVVDRAACRRHPAGLRRAGGDAHRWPTRACSATARCCSTMTARPARGRLGGHRLAAPPGPELRRAAHLLLADADRDPARRGRSRRPTDYTEPGWSRYQSVAALPRHRRRHRVLVRVRHRQPSRPVGQRGCCRTPRSTGTCGPCGSRAAGPGRSASGSRIGFQHRVADPGDPGGVRRQRRDRAAGHRWSCQHRGGPGHRTGRGHRPAAVRCGCPPGATGLAADHRHRAGLPRRARCSAPRWASPTIQVPGVRRQPDDRRPGRSPVRAASVVVLAKAQPQPSGLHADLAALGLLARR